MFNLTLKNNLESSEDSDSISSFCERGAVPRPKFKFPPPPTLPMCGASGSISSQSDDGFNIINKPKKRNKSVSAQVLPPLGFFWDIENCQVPRSKSASSVVQKLRDVFLETYRESEFIVVCDVKKEHPHIIHELHDSQVNLIHISSISKNAADEKLRQTLRRFAELHPAPAGIVLISGDINFAADLSDLRYRKKLRVILVHNNNVADALILCAHEHHSFGSLTESLPLLPFKPLFTSPPPTILTVSNLPLHCHPRKIKNRLNLLTDNCGGRVTSVLPDDGVAYVRFHSPEAASRAQRRIQGEDVYGNKIQTLNHSAVRSFSGQKLKNIENSASKTNNYQFPQSYNQQDAGTYSHFSRDRKHNETSDSCMFRPIRGNGTPMDVGYEQNWRKRRTPHETSMQIGSGRVHKTSASSEFSDEMHFQPIESNNSTKANQAVDLVVTNLDQAIDNKELRRLLTNMLKEHVMIISLNISMQQDGTPIANIRVSSQQEAQFAISQLHRQKLGNKRIMIACSQNNLPDPAQLRIMVINLLQEVPDNCMPLFRFIDLLESRYHCFVSVSEIKKLKDVCSITDDYGSRIISLTNEVKSSPPPNLSRTYLPYCATHCTNQQTRGWCEIKSMQTPCILMSLQLFSKKLIEMLNSHLGFMPLLSFQTCYELEYHEQLPVNENGVPLEHLISCVSNVEIICVGPNKNIKVITQKVKFAEASSEVAAPVKSAQSSPLTPNINLLCRELVDLLKTTDKCQLLLTKFIPAYHHHFGRQCRVADYGYTKLLDLFESIPHVIQIMGDSARKVITLSHNAQLRRFTSDLLRILKVQPMKQILLCDFSAAYEKVMGKSFNAVEYGLCMFEDLLQDLPENTIVITQNTDSGYLIAIPKREQTPEEVLRTKQFAAEVIDLLKHSPYYTMVFNKFVPAYHHHFGHQCKVSDYGFTKLIELFEALPDVVKIQDLDNGERIVSLTQVQGMQILGTQINQMIKNAKLSSILLDDLPSLFLRECGYPLKPDMYECDSVVDLVDRIADYIEVIHSNSGTLLVGLDMDSLSTLLIRCWTLLLKAPHSKDLATFKYEYQSKYNSTFSLNNLQQLEQVVTLTTRADLTCISLTPLYKVAAQLYHVLYKNNGSILYEHLEKFYYDYYGMPLKLANYNIHSVDEFYNQFNLLFFVRGKKKSIVVLKRNLSEHSVLLPPSLFNSSQASVNNAQSWPALANLQESNSASAKVMKVSPPKPDTPPTPGYSLPWSSHWLLSSDNDASFSINMPIVHNPKLLGDPQNLISPAKGLVPSPWSSIPTILAPHPTELPMPDKLMSKGVMADDSTDSGVNTKLDTTHSDNEVDLSSFEKFAGANFLSFNN